LAKEYVSKLDKLGVVYVMHNLCDEEEIRVGHHTTSNKQREREVSFGRSEDWKVIFCLRIESKLKATAVEHVAHALLEKYAHKRKSSDKSGHNRIVYHCSHLEPINAIKKAINILSKDLKIKVLDKEV